MDGKTSPAEARDALAVRELQQTLPGLDRDAAHVRRPNQHRMVQESHKRSLRRAAGRPDAKGSPSLSASRPQRNLCSVARRTDPKRAPRAEVPDPQGRPAGVPGPRRRTPARWNPRERNDLTWGQSSDYEIKSIGSSTTFRTSNGNRKQKRETLYNVTKSEAEETLAKRKEQAKHRQSLRNPDITVAELFGEFFEIKRRTLSASGFERYEGMFRNYVAPAIGNLKVSDLRPEHLIDAYAKWSAKGVSGRPLSGRTVHHLHDLIRCALNFGVRREWVTRNAAACLESEDLPKATKPEPVALNETEMAALLNAARNPSKRAVRSGGPSAESWFYPAVAFAVYTGARRGEVLGLRWTDIDLEVEHRHNPAVTHENA